MLLCKYDEFVIHYNRKMILQSVDFATASKEVTAEINEEVKQQTKGKIEDLIGEGKQIEVNKIDFFSKLQTINFQNFRTNLFLEFSN